MDVNGTAGNDVLIGTDNDDKLRGLAGADTLYGGAGADALDGGTDSDTLYGGADDDKLNGGAGADLMFGGSGNDTYEVYAAGDIVREDTTSGVDDGGFDSVNAGISYTLTNFVEKLTLAYGTAALDGTGNALANTLIGNGAANVLDGKAGADTLYGGAGTDSLYGGTDSDTLYGEADDDTIDGGAGSDVLYGGDGNDTLRGGDGSTGDLDALSGGTGNDVLIGGTGQNSFGGGAGNDIMIGGEQADTFYDEEGTNTIQAGGGDDFVGYVGVQGADTVDLGAGDDEILLRSSSYASQITTGTGVDTIVLDGSIGGSRARVLDFTAGAGGDVIGLVGVLYTIDSNGWDGVTNPFAAGYLQLVQSGTDTLLRLDRDGATEGANYVTLLTLANTTATSFTSANFSPAIPPDGSPIAGQTLTGTSADELFTGGAGSDTIDGGAGSDDLYGGYGNDTLKGGDGSTGDFDTLFGQGGNDVLIGGTGRNSFNGGDGNDIMIGGEQADTFNDSHGSNTILAGGGADVVYGTGFADADTVDLGSGNDQIALSAENASQITTGTGADTIRPFSWDRGGNNLAKVLDFTTGPGGDVLNLVNVLSQVSGWNGVTNPFAAGYLQLVQSGTDTLLRVDADGAMGGASYVTLLTLASTTATSFTSANFSPTFIPSVGPETPPSGGLNVVGGGTEGADTLTGTAGGDLIQGLGGADKLRGLAGADTLYGGAGADALDGGTDSDMLYGGADDDKLNGGAGADLMFGGSGNDTYEVYAAGDIVREDTTSGVDDGGFDSVNAGISYTLTNFVEKLTLAYGTAALDGTGNALANTLIGNGAANVLDGKAGADILYGGAGADTFAFSTALGSGNVDRIIDFVGVDDTIRLDAGVFTALTAGPLSADAFKETSAGGAVDASDRILYNKATGALSYDADGSGTASAAVQFALLDNKATLTAADFIV